jgi:hypothetical protein
MLAGHARDECLEIELADATVIVQVGVIAAGGVGQGETTEARLHVSEVCLVHVAIQVKIAGQRNHGE